jgi:hypothetical protein
VTEVLNLQVLLPELLRIAQIALPVLKLHFLLLKLSERNNLHVFSTICSEITKARWRKHKDLKYWCVKYGPAVTTCNIVMIK